MRPLFSMLYHNNGDPHKYPHSPVNKNYLNDKDLRYTYFGDQYMSIEN